MNNHSVELNSYRIVLKHDRNLDVFFWSVSPQLADGGLNPKKDLITLEWVNIPPNTELSATFSVSGEEGVYSINPVEAVFSDINGNNFVGSCTPCVVTIAPDTSPPDAPYNIRSVMENDAIKISWSKTDADVIGYKVCRRLPDAAYDLNACSYMDYANSSASFTDETVQGGTTYYYAAIAVDASGNESGLSRETGITCPSVSKKIDFSPVQLYDTATGDFNGDGQVDLALALGQELSKNGKIIDEPKVNIYFGADPSLPPDATLYYFANALAAADLNNDGYDELITGNEHASTVDDANLGRVDVFAGAASLDDTPVLTINGRKAVSSSGGTYLLGGESLGSSLAAGGDVNGDGYKDAVIGIRGGGVDRGGAIMILFGGASITRNTIEIKNTIVNEKVGTSVAFAGDVNQDGYDDIVSGTTDMLYYGISNGNIVKAYVYLGGTNIKKWETVFTDIYRDGYFSWEGNRSVGGLDFNNDGFSDIVMACERRTSIFFGGADADTTPDVVIDGTYDGCKTNGDLDGDGISDLITAGPTFFSGNEQKEIFKYTMAENQKVSSVCDTDGDGIKEIFSIGNDDLELNIHNLFQVQGLSKIMLSSGLDDYISTSASNFAVQGAVIGDVTSLVIAGQTVTLGADGAFQFSLPLNIGDNIFEILTTIPDGRIVKRILTVSRTDQASLNVTISSPQEGDEINLEAISVSGTVSDASATVTVNGIPATLNGNTFQADVPLTAGSNLITATATDRYSQTATHSITVSHTGIGTVTGVVKDSVAGTGLSGVAVTLTDAESSVHNAVTGTDGSYAINDVPLGEFSVSCEFAGYIAATGSGTLESGQAFVLDVQMTPIPALTLQILSPSDGITASSTPVAVSGSVSNDASVLVNGVAATVDNGLFSASASLSPGENTIVVDATDVYGQTASDSVSVFLVYPIPSAVIGIDPATIMVGESATLTWSSQDADTCSISPDIGSVANSGSLTVSPAQTTTYSITATGPGGSANESVTVTVTVPSPTVDITANPSDLSAIGESTTLLWSATYTDTCTIDQGIGPVALDGSLTVTPPQTTTYTITATGPGGTATDSVTVTVPLPMPVVSLQVEPSSIVVGETALLSWTSANADALEIDNGIGEVASSGGISVSPADSTTYTITATGPGGVATNQATVSVEPPPITLDITSPQPGEIIDRPSVMVTGTFSHMAGLETGITVNGVLAMVTGNQFLANHVPLETGDNTLTIRATDAEGHMVESTVFVTAEMIGQYIHTDVVPQTGVAPFQAALTINAPVLLQSVEISCPAGATVTENDITAYDLDFTAPGLYQCSIEAEDLDGSTYSDTVVVQAWDRDELDALLTEKWNDMKTDMASGDIQAALNHYSSATRDDYEAIFTALGDQLGQVAEEMQNIELIGMEGGLATCSIQRNEIHQGQAYDITYDIYMDCTLDGTWKILRY